MTKFSTEISPDSIPSMLQFMTGVVEWSTWQRRIEALEAQLKLNPFWEGFLRERHGLELAFGSVKRHSRKTNRYPWPPRTAEEYRLYSFLAIATRVHARLSPRGQARLAGALRSGLEKEFGLGPLVFEMKTAAHLMSAGFDVEFHDLEYGGGYDFLATREAHKVEVECKHISADIGRQIQRRRLYDLGGLLFLRTDGARDRVVGGRLLWVTLPGRLTSNKDYQTTLADRIDAVIAGSVICIEDSVCGVVAQEFPLEDTPFCRDRGHNVSMEDIATYLRQAFSIDAAHVLLNWNPGRAALIVIVQSQQPDRVLEKLLKKLKADAKKQFSGSHPALLCVQLADLTRNQLRELENVDREGTVTGLSQAASILLQSRPHLHSIAFMTDGEVHIAQERSNGGVSTSVQETGPSYVFTKPDHPMAKDPLLRVFQASG